MDGALAPDAFPDRRFKDASSYRYTDNWQIQRGKKNCTRHEERATATLLKDSAI